MSGKPGKAKAKQPRAAAAEEEELVSRTQGLALDDDDQLLEDDDVTMRPADAQSSGQKKKQTQKQQAKGKAAQAEVERFDMNDDEPQQRKQQPQQQRPQAKKPQPGPRRPPSPAHIEEITGSDDEEDDSAASGPQQRKRKVPVLPPKGGASGSTTGAPMSAMQRKAMQQRNKNAVKGLDGKHAAAVAAAAKARKSGAVEVEDESDDDLIDEEEEEYRRGRDDDDDDEEFSGSEGDEAGAASNSDDDGIEWETPAQRRAKKLAAAAAAASGETKRFKVKTVLLWLLVLAIGAGLIWFKLQDSSMWHAGDADDLVSQPPDAEGGDLYTVLSVPRTASLKEIKAAYRRAVLSTHPDKNPTCADCAERFQRVQKAYDVLSHADKRSLYDSVETTYDLLRSEATELTAANFDRLVLHSPRDEVWVVELYTDWHKSAIRFSAAWEEAIQRFGGTAMLRFGRIHAQREQALARTLDVKFGVIPSVVLFADGQFKASKAFRDGSASALPKLARWLQAQYPNAVESVANDVASIREFMGRGAAAAKSHPGTPEAEQAAVLFVPDFKKNLEQARKQPSPPRSGSQQQRFQAQMLQTDVSARVNEPALPLKAIARQFQGAFNVGQVKQIDEPDQWKKWIKGVSAAFKLTPPSQLPALLYQEDVSSAPVWLSGESLNKDKLRAQLDTLHRRRAPWFNSHGYARHCAAGGADKESEEGSANGSNSKRATTCVLALQCAPLRNAAAEFNAFVSSVRTLRNSASAKQGRLQFAKADATGRQSDLEALCSALPESERNAESLHYVAVTNHATVMFHARAASVALETFVQRVMKHDEALRSLPAPIIAAVHIPDDVLPVHIPGVPGGPLLVPLRWLYIGGILVTLWLFAPLISKHFSSFLQIIFALSIAVPAFELAKDVFAKYS